MGVLPMEQFTHGQDARATALRICDLKFEICD